MSTGEIQFLALPNGRLGDSLRLSVVISPRLDTAKQLSGAFTDWPGYLRRTFGDELPMRVDFSGIDPKNVTASLRYLQPPLWTTLLGDLVEEGAPPVVKPLDRAKLRESISSYPVRTLGAFARKTYGRIALEAAQALAGTLTLKNDLRRRAPNPSLSRLRSALDDLRLYLEPDAPGTTRERLRDALASLKTAGPEDVGRRFEMALRRLAASEDRPMRPRSLETLQALVKGDRPADKVHAAAVEFALFHSQLPHHSAEMAESIGKCPPPRDFHARLAAVKGEPAVLRPLGLVFDLLVPLAGNPQGRPSPQGTVQVRLGNSATIASFSTRHAATQYVLTEASFEAASRTNLFRSGMLDLQAKDDAQEAVFHLETMDVDGTTLKAMHAAEAAERARAYSTSDSGTALPLPSTRSCGISLVMKERGKSLEDMLARAAHEDNLRDGGEPLFAEDLLLGYRVDVWSDDSRSWRSLCERVGHYAFTNASGAEVPFTPDPGWSEGVVHIGASRSADDTSDIKVRESLFRWENWSLCVGLGDRPVNEGERPVDGDRYCDDQSMPTEGYLAPRFDVPDSSLPTLRFGVGYRVRCRIVDVAGNGRSLTQVEKSYDLGADDGSDLRYLRHEPVGAPTLLVSDPEFRRSSPGEQADRPVLRDGHGPAVDRFLVPPRATQGVAELHGEFDKDLSPELFAGAFQRLHLDDDGSFPALDKSAEPSPENSDAYLASSVAGEHHLAHYPDPLARCCHLQLFDAYDRLLESHEFEFFKKAWPDATPLMVRMVPQDHGHPPMFRDRDPKGHPLVAAVNPDGPHVPVLEVLVPRGETARVEVSSGLCRPSALDGRDPVQLLAVWRMLSTELEAVPPTALKASDVLPSIRQGLHGMLTPHREITLVHAVRKPLDPLVWDAPPGAVDRTRRNATFADIKGLLICHGPSTARIDALAQWQDDVDDLSEPGPRPRDNRAVAFHLTPGATDREISLPSRSVRHEFGDTKAHTVRYVLEASTRFEEYYRPGRTETRRGPEMSFVVRSSCRPSAPAIAHVVPAFRWQREASRDSQVSRRWGGGIRVYLERPWFSSGNGELLAAVLGRFAPISVGERAQRLFGGGHSADGLPRELRHLVTQWGRDPLWASASLPRVPSPQHFRNVAIRNGAPVVATDLLLDEAGNDPRLAVSAAGFVPEYDASRRLWFCDLEMDPFNSYFPFVRLALARYQPDSIPGVELSPVVLADFHQLTPDRIATVHWLDKKRGRAQLSVHGPTYEDSAAGKQPSFMRISIEERGKSLGDSVSIAWEPLQGHGRLPAMELRPVHVQDGIATWTAEVLLPKVSSHDYRLLVEEVEEYLTDDPRDRANITRTGRGTRVVYADQFEI